VVRSRTGFYRTLAPATKLVVALAEVAVSLAIGGGLVPAVVLLAVVLLGARAGVLKGLASVALVTSPIVASIILINLFLLPGATDPIVQLGPLAPTWSGLAFGLQVTLRLLAMSLALASVYLTTDVDDLLADLEARGAGRRAIFVVGAALETVPRMVERASDIVAAQRARGLDTEGRFWRRARGVLPLAAPLIFGALTEVEERTVALESRAFSAPGRRTPLRVLADPTVERLIRWAAFAAAVILILVHLAGLVRFP
jgi:energy-coupling factor transport system permease protein